VTSAAVIFTCTPIKAIIRKVAVYRCQILPTFTCGAMSSLSVWCLRIDGTRKRDDRDYQP